MTDQPPDTTKKKTVSRRAGDEGSLLGDARRVYSVAKKYLKDFVAADKGAKHRRVDAAFLARMLRLVGDAQKARGAAPNALIQLTSATRTEEAQRAAVAGFVLDIRDRIKTTYAPAVSADGRIDDGARKELFKAFGVGANVRADDTGQLLDLADHFAISYEDDTLGTYARHAGITPKTMASLAKARAALADADTVQNTKIGLRKGGTVTKKQLFDALKKATAFVRATAKSVFRGQPNKLRELDSTVPKAKARKKK